MTSGHSPKSGTTFSINQHALKEELQRVMSSPAFEDAERLQRFLKFVIEETLQGRGARLKESVIGIEVFGRSASYDPIVPLLGSGERTVAQLQGVSTEESPRIEFSRDGKHLYASERPAVGAPLRVVDIDLSSGARRVLTQPAAGSPGDAEAALSPDGKWLAFRRRTESSIDDVFAIPANGGPARAIDRSGIVGLAWTRDSDGLIVSSRRRSSLQRLWRFSLAGAEPILLTDAVAAASYPTVSPRDESIAYASRFLDSNIWRIDLAGTAPARRLIESTLLDSSPHYSPDEQRIAFRSNRTGNDELWVAGANGELPARVTNFGGPVTGNAHWSPDGQYLAVDSRPYGNADVFWVPAGGGSPRRVTSERSNDVLPSFSSDGKFLYFASDRTASWQIWRQAAGGERRVRSRGTADSLRSNPTMDVGSTIRRGTRRDFSGCR